MPRHDMRLYDYFVFFLLRLLPINMYPKTHTHTHTHIYIYIYIYIYIRAHHTHTNIYLCGIAGINGLQRYSEEVSRLRVRKQGSKY